MVKYFTVQFYFKVKLILFFSVIISKTVSSNQKECGQQFINVKNALKAKNKYRWTSLFADSVSAVSLIRDKLFVPKPQYSRIFQLLIRLFAIFLANLRVFSQFFLEIYFSLIKSQNFQNNYCFILNLLSKSITSIKIIMKTKAWTVIKCFLKLILRVRKC